MTKGIARKLKLFVLLVAMVVCIPLCVKAAGNYVTEVAIGGIDAPEPGEYPDYAVTVPQGANYGVSEICWYRLMGSGDFTPMEDDETFLEGGTYKVAVTVTVYDNYEFATDDSQQPAVTGKINEVDSTVSKVFGMQAWYQVELSYTFSPCPRTVVKDIVIEMQGPLVNSYPQYPNANDFVNFEFATKEIPMHLYSEGRYWLDASDNSPIYEEKQFEAGKVYRFEAYVKPAVNCGFDSIHNMNITINGEKATVVTASYDRYRIYADFPCYGYVYETNTEITSPVAGETPEFSGVETNGEIETCDNFTWYDVTDDKSVSIIDTFKEGHVYRVEFTLTPKNLYKFATNFNGEFIVKAKVNGALATCEVDKWSEDIEYLNVTYTFPAVEASQSGNDAPSGGEAGGGNAGGNVAGSGDPQVDISTLPEATVAYRTHVQSIGWQRYVTDGVMAGTSGISKRLEGIEIFVGSADPEKELDLGIQYTTHCQSYGWLPWSADGDMSGTEGEAKRLEAIMIKLTGKDAEYYDVYYRVHAQSYGWLGWAKDGAPAGTAGYGKRLEGIQIVVVKKDASFDKEMGQIKSVKDEAFVAKAGNSPIVNYPATSNTAPVVPGDDMVNVSYRTHVQKYGWQGWKYNGAMSGTSGEAKRLEGIEIKLTNTDYNGGIAYCTHVQTYAWQGADLNDPSTWKSNGEMAGTSGEAKRLEAICITLTGEMANHYDIYYRVHAQSYGWLGWAKNGAPSGTAGYAKRLEGIQIVLVPKGGVAPAKNYGGITSNNDKPYIQK